MRPLIPTLSPGPVNGKTFDFQDSDIEGMVVGSFHFPSTSVICIGGGGLERQDLLSHYLPFLI